MANPSPQPALIMRPIPPDWLGRRPLTSLALASLAYLAIATAVADTTTDSHPKTTPEATAEAIPQALSSYVARYKTTARGFTLYLERELRIGEDHRYILTNGGKILVIGFHEVSVFTVRGGQILPQSYVYRGTGMVNRKREVHFDSGSKIRSLYKGQWYQLPYSAGTLDRMSQWEQLRLALLENGAAIKEMTLKIADGKRVKNSQLEFVAEEELTTALGAVDTLHFRRLHDNAQRQSDIWLAPQWDYLMVKTVHVEDGEPVEVSLVSAVIDGVPVAVH